MYKYTNS